MENNNTNNSLKDEFCIWNTIKTTETETEISEEYILPDYLPEIKRVLSLNSFVRNNGVYAEKEMINISGELCFNLVYLGDGGLIRCVFFSKDYSTDIPGDESLNSAIIRDETLVKNAECRPLTPRKLNFKAKIITKCDFLDKTCITPKVTGGDKLEDEFTIERNTQTKESVNYISKNIEDIRVSEDIEIDAGSPEIKEILSADVDLFSTECRASKGKIFIKGNARVTCLCSAVDESGEKYIVTERNIPISHAEETQLLDENWDMYSTLELGEMQTGTAKNNYGENKIIELDFICKAKIMCMKNEPTNFTTDAFSTEYEYDNTYKNINDEKLIRVHNANFSLDGKSPLPKNENITDILCCKSNADIKEAEISEGKIYLIGDCYVNSVLKTDGEENYIPFNFTFPVKVELPSENADNFKYLCHTGILKCNCRLDAENIICDIELGITLCVFEINKTNVVSNINLDTSKQSGIESPAILLYYPEKNETSWDIAKKYSVRQSEIDNQDKDKNVILIKKRKNKPVFDRIITD